mgnify:CR=1
MTPLLLSQVRVRAAKPSRTWPRAPRKPTPPQSAPVRVPVTAAPGSVNASLPTLALLARDVRLPYAFPFVSTMLCHAMPCHAMRRYVLLVDFFLYLSIQLKYVRHI